MKKENHNLLKAIIWAVIFTSSLISCKKETVNPDSKQINFQAPSANQENTYIRYFGFCDYFNPTFDTMILQVVSNKNHVLQLRERFTPHSPMYVYHPDPLNYEVIWNEEYIITTPDVRNMSNLFFFFAADTLWLKKPPAITLTQDQCRLYQDSIPFEGGAIGRIPLFEAGAEEFLQKQVITKLPVSDTIDIWDQYLVFDSHNIYSSFRNVKQNIYIQSPTVSAYTLIDN